MSTTQPYLTVRNTLLALFLPLLFIPTTASAQMFGGMIKAGHSLAFGSATFTLPYDKLIYSTAEPLNSTKTLGVIDNSSNKIVLSIPYTSGSGSYSAYSGTAVTTPTGQSGDVNGLSISYPAGTFNATGTIPVTITVDGDGTYNILRQNADLTSLVATLPFYVNGVNKGNITLTARGGILDKMYNLADNAGSTTNHLFIYTSVVGADGNTWLNNNLGADYANVNSSSFNIPTQASVYNDYHAYGSLFQWGRKPDGHELINWTGSATGTPVYGSIAGPLAEPLATANFITNGSDWRSPANSALWATESSTNNPCPSGFRVPTQTEQAALVTAIGGFTIYTGVNNNLKIPAVGVRINSSAALGNTSLVGQYWNSATSNNKMYINTGGASFPGTSANSYGFSVRCIKN